jgi:hypothetical protein
MLLILADHNRLVREGLFVLIRLQPDLELLAATAALSPLKSALYQSSGLMILTIGAKIAISSRSRRFCRAPAPHQAVFVLAVCGNHDLSRSAPGFLADLPGGVLLATD